MPQYIVRWEIDIDAETPEAAAAQALEIQRDPDSIATVFDVVLASEDDGDVGTVVDLHELNRYV